MSTALLERPGTETTTAQPCDARPRRRWCGRPAQWLVTASCPAGHVGPVTVALCGRHVRATARCGRCDTVVVPVLHSVEPLR